MDGRTRSLNPSVQRRLSITLSLAIMVMALAAGALSFLAAYNEARELQDDTLERVAGLVAQMRTDSRAVPRNFSIRGEEDDTIVIVQWLVPGAAAAAADAIDLPLAPTLADGWHALGAHGENYRVLVTTTSSGERFAVAQDSRLRQELSRYGALRTALPVLLLVPLLLMIVGQLLRKLFGPMRALAAEVDARGDGDLHAIPEHGVPHEVAPFIVAMNRLLRRVAEAMAQQRRFVADAAHELRSPLTALGLQAERLAATDLPDEARTRLDALQHGIGRSQDLVAQLLSLARAEAERTTQPVACSLREVSRRVLEDLLPLADARGVEPCIEGANDAEVMADPFDLHTLLRNLVDNAIRYAPRGGTVRLVIERNTEHARLDVIDTGPGLTQHEWLELREPFRRKLDTDETGSGLGLAIAHAIAARLEITLDAGFADVDAKRGLRVSLRFP